MSSQIDYYVTLGISATASTEEIKAAYRRLAKEYHPDKHAGDQEKEEIFKGISEAYTVLSDDSKRALYDYRRFYQTSDHEEAESKKEKIRNYYRYRKSRRPKYVYSVQTKIYGAVFVILLTLVAISFPVGLEVYSVEKHFKKGKSLLAVENYDAAVKNLDLAIRDIGLRTREAATILCEVSYYELRDYPMTINYAKIALASAELPTVQSKLHRLKGQAHAKLKEREIAKEELLLALNATPSSDSIFYQLGLLELNQFRDNIEAKRWFDKVAIEELKLPMNHYHLAVLHYELKEYYQALHYAKSYLAEKPESGTALKIAAMTSFKVKDSNKGCEYLKLAVQKGYRIDNPIITKFCGL